MTRFCKDCKHFFVYEGGHSGGPRCRRPFLDLVTGTTTKLGEGASVGMPEHFCVNQRQGQFPVGAWCGPEGRYWERMS